MVGPRGVGISLSVSLRVTSSAGVSRETGQNHQGQVHSEIKWSLIANDVQSYRLRVGAMPRPVEVGCF